MMPVRVTKYSARSRSPHGRCENSHIRVSPDDRNELGIEIQAWNSAATQWGPVMPFLTEPVRTLRRRLEE